MKKTKITFLGTGTSTGVPTLGCRCNVCLSTDKQNKRFRSSILIEFNNKKILIDTPPDLRSQLLQNNIQDIDAVILTHTHADHVHGIDDLRPFCFIHKKSIPIHTNIFYIKELEQRFAYIFDKKFVAKSKNIGGGIPNLEAIEVHKKHKICGMDFNFFELPHGPIKTLGVFTDQFAYLIDCNEIPNELIKKLKEMKLDTLIIDCVRIKPHSTHLHLDKTLEYIEKIQPKEAYLTHLSHDFDHDSLQSKVSTIHSKIHVAYDGLILHIS